ncbi:spore coat protein U domain-containing protein [Sodalis sp. RH21]|uniref:spore coat protein U domain-containing protein n=1 Tax=unclassified Sodalis (in: enterobacteria) TaxID=2636512 RepID=UPI0039B49EE8
MSLKPIAYFACALLWGLFSTQASAYDCSISATPLNFGAIQGIAGMVQRSTATITVVCSGGASAANVSYRILIDGPAAQAPRQISSGSHSASYQLYTSGDYQQVWGNGGGGVITDSYSLEANAAVTRTYTVYAKMTPSRNDPPGSYIANAMVQLIY